MEKSNNPPITDAVVKRVEDLLVDGEELLLVAQPAVERLILDPIHKAAMVVATFAILLACGLVSNINFGMKNSSAVTTIEVFYAVIFAAIGLWILTYMVRVYRTSTDHIYAITNLRAIIMQPGREEQSYGRRDITQLKIRPWRDGYDDLLFSSVSGGKGENVSIGFMGIPEAEEVRRLILNTFDFDEHDFWQN